MSETEGPPLTFTSGVLSVGETAGETIEVGDPMPRLGSVAHHADLKLAVSWRHGLRAERADIVDLAPMLMTYKVYRPLRDNPELFKSVHLTADGTAIAWGDNDAIDMAATTIERLAEESMTSSDFHAWLDRLKLTYEAAAAQLGISRRLVAYYADKRDVPRYIALACRYLEQQNSPPLPASHLASYARGLPANEQQRWAVSLLVAELLRRRTTTEIDVEQAISDLLRQLENHRASSI
jgi:hypothetical protein